MTKTFADLKLRPEILKAIQDVGYETPTPIQAQAIPIVMRGSDVLGIAQTGTGKTAGFTLPMIHSLCKGRARARMPRSLILAPTRELAAQVAENFELYGKHTRLKHALLVGGVNMDQQIKKLTRGVDVLIATPGRLIDLFERGKILMSDVRILVIDECDRMLDMGFIPDIEKIVSNLPRMRQTMMFSATLPPEINRLAAEFLISPQEVHVAPPSSTTKTVKAFQVKSGPRDKRKTLRDLIAAEEVKNAFIFCNRKVDVGELHRSLLRHGFNAGALHGDMTQHERTETLEKFKNDEITLLVCSDVAARGLDISAVSHVFNFDVPFNAEDYVHRIGRTGRAGETGRAFSLVTRKDEGLVDAIEELIGKPLEEYKLSKGGKKPAKSSGDDKPKSDDKKPRKGKSSAAREEDKAEVEATDGHEKSEDKPSRSRGGRGRKKAAEDSAQTEAEEKAKSDKRSKSDDAEDDANRKTRRRRPRRRKRKGDDDKQQSAASDKSDNSKAKKSDGKASKDTKKSDDKPAKSRSPRKSEPKRSEQRKPRESQTPQRHGRGGGRGGRRRPLSPADEVESIKDTGKPGFGDNVPAFFSAGDDD